MFLTKRLKFRIKSKVEENRETIMRLFPDCVYESKSENGKTIKVIDFDKLKQEISGDILFEGNEVYTMTWPDKKKASILANNTITTTLRPLVKESIGKDGTVGKFDSKNIYIEGDNLDVLKCLRETYLETVKMIYIDPPYNTGNDFVYDDNFYENVGEYLNRSNQFDEYGHRMVQNMESNGRFHTDWLNMIYPRLKVAKDLLKEDGVIFISIDDNEVHNLRKVCDEIFGARNFIGEIIWLKGNAQNDAKNIEKNHEYVICYQKALNPNLYITKKEIKEIIKENDKYWYKGAGIITGGAGGTLANRPNLGYTIYYNPKTDDKIAIDDYDHQIAKISNIESEVYKTDLKLLEKGYIAIRPPKKGKSLGRWTWAKEKFNSLKDEIYIKENNNSFSVFKKIFVLEKDVFKKGEKYFYEAKIDAPLKSFINISSSSGTTEVNQLFESKVFDNPKPIDLILHLINSIHEKDCIVMDFFSGSGTTACAVIEANKKDDLNRRFVLVQIPEKINEAKESYKIGYKNICEIAKERIRRAGDKIKGENLENLDIGCRVFKLDSSNMKDVYYEVDEYKQNFLDIFLDNIKEDRTDEDLVIQICLEIGLKLDVDIVEIIVANKKVYSVDGGNLVCCFEKDLDDNIITEIAKLKPDYAVFRDCSLKDDSFIVNLDQIFENYSPQTARRII